MAKRAYSSGTEKALFRLASGNCYFPDCLTPILRVVRDNPIVGVDIAHIRGLEPTSARFDKTMTDQQRNSFHNLILMCTAHHKEIDRENPDLYPVDLLLAWKAEREKGGLAALASNDVASASNLEALIRKAVADARERPAMEVVLLPGVVTQFGLGVLFAPFEEFSELLELNPALSDSPQLLVVDLVNTGSIPVQIDSIDIHWAFRRQGVPDQFEATSMGHNNYPDINPKLPMRLAAGSAERWHMARDESRRATRMADATFDGMYATVSIATGETFSSAIIPWSAVQAAGFTDADR